MRLLALSVKIFERQRRRENRRAYLKSCGRAGALSIKGDT
jgi:hypothetical protein